MWHELGTSGALTQHVQIQGFLKDVAADDDLYFMPPFELEELMQLQPWVSPSRKRFTPDTVRVCATSEQSQGCAKACSNVTPASDTFPS